MGITGNESILAHYFTNSTLAYNSVSIKLADSLQPFYVYSINIRGRMDSCDAYLGVKVYDETSEWLLTQVVVCCQRS